MTQKNENARAAYKTIVSCFPHHKAKDGEQEGWEFFLVGLTPEMEKAAWRVVMRTPEIWPKWMPSVGEFLAKVREEAWKSQAPAPPQEASAPEFNLDATNPGERLARAFEEESQRLGIDPNRQTPHEVARDRMRQIREGLLNGLVG